MAKKWTKQEINELKLAVKDFSLDAQEYKDVVSAHAQKHGRTFGQIGKAIVGFRRRTENFNKWYEKLPEEPKQK